MKAIVRGSLKNGIVFAAIGVVVALAAAPLLAAAAATMGLAAGGLLGAATIAGVFGSALGFGGFGIVYPRLKSALGNASGKNLPETAKVPASRQPDGDARQAPEQSLEADVAKATFCQRVDADRAAAKAAASISI